MSTVVLLHALAMDATMWDEQRDALAASGCRVLAPNLTSPTESTIDSMVDRVAAHLDDAGVRTATLVGSSMGGYVAMAFLRRHPGRVAALCLLAARATEDDAAVRAGREAFAQRVVTAGPGMIEATVPKLVGATTRAHRADIVERVRAMALAADVRALASAQRAIAGRADSRDVLRDTDVPVVVIAGDEDELVSLAEASATAAVAGAPLVVVAGAGHLTPLEAPATVTDVLLDLAC